MSFLFDYELRVHRFWKELQLLKLYKVLNLNILTTFQACGHSHTQSVAFITDKLIWTVLNMFGETFFPTWMMPIFVCLPPLLMSSYSFSRWSRGLAPGVEGEPGSCFRLLGDILWPGDGFWRLLEARRIPVIEVAGGWGAPEGVGGDPRPGKAPESERAGFWTAMIWPPEAERTCGGKLRWKMKLFERNLNLHNLEFVGVILTEN